MPVTTCINHPTRQATARCKRCGRPICNDCKMVSEVGVVCSQQCLDAIKSFQERIGDDIPGRSRRRLLSRRLIKTIVGICFLFGLAYAILCFQKGRMLSPSDLADEMDNWFWFVKSLF